jgi:NhaP-type Na+/H+ and K+/H+ antiporter
MKPTPNVLLAMIFRGNRVIIPRREDDLRAGDHVYMIVPSTEYPVVADFVGLPPPREIERVFVVGGRQIGIEAALRLEKKVSRSSSSSAICAGAN